MFKIKSKICALLFVILAAPTLVSAESFDSSSFDLKAPFASAAVGKVADKRCSSSGELRLRDFEGEWVFKSTSVGGVAGPTAVGVSQVINGQVSIGRRGTGFVNYASGAFYAGVPGVITQFGFAPTTTTLNIAIIDAEHGVGAIVISDPTRALSITIDFIATRSRDGRVLSFQGHKISFDADDSAITSYTFERQIL